MRIKARVFWVISLVLSLFNCCLLPAAFYQQIMDNDYLNSLQLPSSADSLGIPLAGAITLALILAIFHIFLHGIIFFVNCKRKSSAKFINLDGILMKNNQLGLNIIRILSYLISIGLIYLYIISYFRFYIMEFLLYLTFMLVIADYIIWISAIFNKNIQT